MEGRNTTFTLVPVMFGIIIRGTAQPLVPAIITFGDSTVDAGNNDYLPAIFKADFPPYGRDFKNHVPTGRFCNGKLATDFTADMLGFTSYAPAYLSPQASGKNLLIGANFASAASGYYDHTAYLYNAISLPQQLKYYKEYRSKLNQVIGTDKTNGILNDSLYILSTGTGDFLQNYYKNSYMFKSYTPDQFSDLLIGIFYNFVKDLYGLGGRRLGVISLPPLGCLPAAIKLYGHGSNARVARFNDDAKKFNKKLADSVDSLSKQYSTLKIAVLDIYQPLYDLAS